MSTSTSVHRYLVTTPLDRKMDVWLPTAFYANWLDAKKNGDQETWLVTCFEENATHFKGVCEAYPDVTLQEIHTTGMDEPYGERYELISGDEARGWHA
jgi:hypothetical protein